MKYRNLIFLILISCTFSLSAKIVSLDCKAYFMDIDTVGKTVTTSGKERSWEYVYGGLVISSTRYTWYDYDSLISRKSWIDRNTLIKSSEAVDGSNRLGSLQCKIIESKQPKI